MGLRTRLLLAFLFPALLVLSAGGFLLFRASRAALEDELGRSLAAVAAAVAAELKAERVLSIEPGDEAGEGSRTWRALHAQLTELQKRTRVRRIFVVDSARHVRLDVGGPHRPGAEAVELLRDEDELERVARGRLSSSQVLFEGTDGVLYKTGYAPLLDGEQVVGIVAVEGSAAFFGPLRQLRVAFAGLLLVTLLLLAAAAALTARALALPLERMVSSALRIGGGDLTTPVIAEGPKELGVLARELDAMRLKLESRDRQLKLMLGGVAHEVKNPLGGMELFAGLIDEELRSEKPDVGEAQSHLGRVRRELLYLKRIVDDFLAFAREQRVNLEDVNAKDLVESAARHLAGEAESRGVTLKVEAAAATLKVDASLVTSALVNLVKNAVQASGASKTVSVTGRVVEGVYEVTVHDEGPGIPEDVQQRIFEPFFTTREQGTGLGLPLAKKLLEANRGTLSLISSSGSTTFRLTFPV